jgi:phenylacetate-coenzyme A ligase PaaK-like adenylate-forming protein
MVVPHDRLVRLHSSSGTSGKPTIVGHGEARFFPSQVETVLVEDPAVALDYQLVVDADRVTVHCEPVDAATGRAALKAVRVLDER